MSDTRAVIIGSGIAGLATALELGDCVVVTKTALGEGSSRWAQGGIAAAIGPGDTPALHATDTVRVSGGLASPGIADLVAAAAPDRVGWLTRLGADFDRDQNGALILGREAGHTRHRIVHADGDATGAEMMRTLVAAVTARSDIEVMDRTHAIDLVFAGGAVSGVVVLDPAGHSRVVEAGAVVLATGGIGRIYAATTNPAEVTGDGLAMAIRAGARIIDPEFVQFHPTALRSALDPMPLLTEALRGAGAVLVDRNGARFMQAEHPDAELAPRDIVARAIWRRLAAGGDIALDATHLGSSFPERFPTVYASAKAAGIDPVSTPIPVSPAAHYHMGGVATDAHGRTSLPGLFAGGEVASTGLHGANRLASNSLLEGLVFAGRIAEAIGTDPVRTDPIRNGSISTDAITSDGAGDLSADDPSAIDALRQVMWQGAGLVRSGPGLRDAARRIDELRPRLDRGPTGRNMACVADLVVAGARQRTESRGAHYRIDHPETEAGWRRHTVIDPIPVVVKAPAEQRGAA